MKFLILSVLVFCATARADILYKGPSGIITRRGPIGPDGRGARWASSEESNESAESIESAESLESIESGESSESWEHGQWRRTGLWKADNNVILNGPSGVISGIGPSGDDGQWKGKGVLNDVYQGDNGLWKNDNGVWKGDNGLWKSDTGAGKSSWGGNDNSIKGKGGW